MSQQLQQPMSQPSGEQYQPSHGAQPSMGQQVQQPQGQATGQRFQQSVPVEVQRAVNDLDQLETVCLWVQAKATQRGRGRVAQRCEDLADIANLEKELILRESPFAATIGQAVTQSIQQGVQELQQHASDPEIQEALTQAQQTLSTIGQALQRIQSMSQQGTGMQQQQFQSQQPMQSFQSQQPMQSY